MPWVRQCRGTASTLPPKNRALSLRVWLVNVLIRVQGGRASGFVEGDMPVGADAQNLEVNAAGVRNGAFVHLARGRQVRGQSVGPRHVSRIDIDLVNELVPDDAEVPLRMVLRQADILVEHERSRLR